MRQFFKTRGYPDYIVNTGRHHAQLFNRRWALHWTSQKKLPVNRLPSGVLGDDNWIELRRGSMGCCVYPLNEVSAGAKAERVEFHACTHFSQRSLCGGEKRGGPIFLFAQTPIGSLFTGYRRKRKGEFHSQLTCIHITTQSKASFWRTPSCSKRTLKLARSFHSLH